MDTPCTLFAFRKDKNGYGRLTKDGTTWQAHRYYWTMAHGPIPAGLLVCHQCDTPACINLDHLYLGTPADNMRDKCDRGRTPRGDAHDSRLHPERRPRGEKHALCKVVDRCVEEAIQRYRDGETQAAIAASLGVAQRTISRYVRHESRSSTH